MQRFEDSLFILCLAFACAFAMSMVVFLLNLTLGGNTEIPLAFAGFFGLLALVFSIAIA